MCQGCIKCTFQHFSLSFHQQLARQMLEHLDRAYGHSSEHPPPDQWAPTRAPHIILARLTYSVADCYDLVAKTSYYWTD